MMAVSIPSIARGPNVNPQRWFAPHRSSRRLGPALATLALIGVLATGCGGGESGAAVQAPTAPAAIPERGVIGAAQQGDGIEASIDAIRRGEASEMVDVDPSTEEIDTHLLEAGQAFLILDVTVSNIGPSPHEYNALSWSATSPQTGEAYGVALLAMTGYDLAAGDLDPGEERSGQVVIAIPASATALNISYDTQLFNQGTQLDWTVDLP